MEESLASVQNEMYILKSNHLKNVQALEDKHTQRMASSFADAVLSHVDRAATAQRRVGEKAG
jgi:hypothetical protein